MSDFRGFIQERLGSRATDDFMDWLEGIGFYSCPAAKAHHGNYDGGLYNHSMKVADELQNLTNKLGLTWVYPESPWVVGLLHDICKCDDYKYDFEKSDNIEWNPHHSGHGAKSIIMLAGHFPLSEEEKYCILYHMGAFTDEKEWKFYSQAVRTYPNVLYTHTADMIASQIYGV